MKPSLQPQNKTASPALLMPNDRGVSQENVLTIPNPRPRKSRSPEKNTSATGAGRKIQFRFDAPEAGSVLLAGDFTEWGKSPVQLLRNSDGIWETSVPLTAGSYAYRFIVDGEWCDDPGCQQKVLNPFGTTNSVLQVV